MNDVKCGECAKVLKTEVSEYGDTFVQPCQSCQFTRAKNLREMARQKELEGDIGGLAVGYCAGLMHASQICASEVEDRSDYILGAKAKIIRNGS